MGFRVFHRRAWTPSRSEHERGRRAAFKLVPIREGAWKLPTRVSGVAAGFAFLLATR